MVINYTLAMNNETLNKLEVILNIIRLLKICWIMRYSMQDQKEMVNNVAKLNIT